MIEVPPDPPVQSPEHDACGIGFVAHLRGQPGHRIVAMALEALTNLSHRGARGADAESGDGVGVLVQLPRRFLGERLEEAGGGRPNGRPDAGPLAVGMFFWPPGGDPEARRLVESELGGLGFEVAAWRDVPVRPEVLGETARRSLPAIRQAFVRCPSELDGETIERRLYRARRRIERGRSAAGLDGSAGVGCLHVVSLSHRSLVYKALCLAPRLGAFYPDLRDPAFETGLALFHQRFSTNTAATWRLAQPFRFLAHNGEINTLQGNVNWMTARERELARAAADDGDPGGVDDLLPVLEAGGSDSALLDNALEFLVRGGRDPLHAMMMLIPEASRPGRDPRRAAFFDYHAGLMEPWDGPAAVVFSDGRIAGALLDRNGLRPQRYWLTVDDLVILGSETGLVDLPDDRIRRKGRLGPGEVLAVDTTTGELLLDGAIKRRASRRRPYRDWLRHHRVELPPLPAAVPPPEADGETLLRIQALFGYSREVLDDVLDPMVRTGRTPVASMGNDAPPAVLSRQPQLVYAYFRQRFAQVTNPAIDSLRERAVFSLETLAGGWGSPLEERPDAAALVRLPSPLLDTSTFDWLRGLDDRRFEAVTLEATFEVAAGGEGLRAGLERLFAKAEAAVDRGASLLVLSDRRGDRERAPIPMLLATGGVHHHLVRRRKRMQASLVCDTGEPREDHHVACLIGYGATVVHPWLVYRTLADRARAAGADPAAAIDRYREALETSLLKIMGKLGVCAVTSYQGAQLFEALGLDAEVIELCFPGTPSRIGGAGWEELAGSAAAFHRQAWSDQAPSLVDRGSFRYRRDGEHHALNPKVFKALHRAAADGEPESYASFAAAADGGPPSSLRDLLDWRPAGSPLEIDRVEPAEPILARFSTAAMSHGALSREAHETLAVAMNRLGGRSNSGEGGEDPERFEPYSGDRRPAWNGDWSPGDGDWGNSAIKQIASGRFGVTAHYLLSAREIEIKMAQGSKPGEGGEIPGHKVTAEIAAQRRSTEGRPLISPPPHHDIYSIEDLAQLIYDLRRVHPEARIGVKLVAGTGVGTIAVGVAKAHADYIQISGDCGGTGASALSSIKHAGLPWELGLAEAQRELVRSGLRGRVALRVDGGLRTGRDVVLAALLGADEMGFGTAPLIAMGCIMARQCHLDTCPVGIATQRAELRAKFTGRPERVEAYLGGVAGQVREILAAIGLARLDEIVGRTDLLRRREREDGAGARVDLAVLLAGAGAAPAGSPEPAIRRVQPRNPRPEDRPPLDERVWEAGRAALDRGIAVRASFDIRNRERSVGARLSGAIARRTGGRGLDPGTVELDFAGVAGQSFGAFLVRGVTLRLTGETQDYAGKGMSGGELIVRPPEARQLDSARHVIAGNTLLYGATGGRCLVAGRAGERFAVRNSGAVAVVEGCGDYGCEYMTAGVVVVLGPVGRSFGAGMTGGTAFVLDRRGALAGRLDRESVVAGPPASAEDSELLWRLIRLHAMETGSGLAWRLLARWERSLAAFRRVVPLGAPAAAGASEPAPAGAAVPVRPLTPPRPCAEGGRTRPSRSRSG